MAVRAKSMPVKSVHKKPASKPDRLALELDELRMPADGHKTDVRYARSPWQRRREIGRALRDHTPRESHGNTTTIGNRPDPLNLLTASNQGRQKDLIPLRMGRMSA